MSATERQLMPAEKTINLALQGGGSHGAFAWGVLDAHYDQLGRESSTDVAARFL